MSNRLSAFAAIGAAAAAAFLLSLTSSRGDLILFNASASAPEGFYVRDKGGPRRGAFATVRAADVAGAYARLRHFDGARDRFIKRIAAGMGDLVCARGQSVIVATRVLWRLNRDGQGRALPQWQGCRRLGPGEWFLLGDADGSFDSRYWGPVTSAEIEGVWRPMFNTASQRLPRLV